MVAAFFIVSERTSSQIKYGSPIKAVKILVEM